MLQSARWAAAVAHAFTKVNPHRHFTLNQCSGEGLSVSGNDAMTQAWLPRGVGGREFESNRPIISALEVRLATWRHRRASVRPSLVCLALWDFHPLKIFSVRWNFVVLACDDASQKAKTCRARQANWAPCLAVAVFHLAIT
jgi:hypothetical protein